MPMFDDPRKELNRLQEELLAQEDTSWEDELADLDALLADYEDREVTVKEEYKQVDDLRRMSDILLEEEDDSDLPEEKSQKPQKGVRGLIVIACLETVAIIGLLAWWLLWLR